MNKKQTIESLVHNLMFHGCQHLNVTTAKELAEKIVEGKIPTLTVYDVTETIDFQKKVTIQSNANKAAAIQAMEKFIPERISKDAEFSAEVQHWYKMFISSSLCSGKNVPESIRDAWEAIHHVYGDLGSDLIAQE